MILSLIAAIGRNNELGKHNKLLWSLPADMKHFRSITTGHPVLMGRKTFESIGKVLPNRRNIIITRDQTYKIDGVDIVHSLPDAMHIFKDSEEEVFVIGGADIYTQSIDLADKLYITHIDAEDSGADSFFPEISSTFWKLVSQEDMLPDETNAVPYSFSVYRKI